MSDPYTEISDPARLVTTPVVSVLMLAYNHAPWIAEAIEGVMAQDCDFQYELLIGDDGSADDTRAIALRYGERYADRIRVIFPPTNAGAHANHRRLFGLARGEFIAYCEGDDYWCRPDKLAAQVALLRSDESAAMAHTDWVRARRKDTAWVVDWRASMHRRLPLSRLQGNLFPIFYFPKILRTCTVMQRRSALSAFYDSSLAQRRYRFADTVKAAYLTARGRVAYWPCVSAVYRESPDSALRSGRRSFLEFLRSALEFDTDARAFFRDRDDYPISYRFECIVGLVLGAVSARDRAIAKEALRDLREHYTLKQLFVAAFGALRMRWPNLRVRAPTLPQVDGRAS